MQTSIRCDARCFKGKTSRLSAYRLLAVCAFPLLWQTAALRAQAESGQPLRGKVVFSDGTAARGAKVEVSEICDGLTLSQHTTTAEDGSFSFPLFHGNMLDPTHGDDGCKEYRFRASRREDCWIPSDENVFSGVAPTVPTVDLRVGLPAQPVQIVLSIRGGEVSFRVWDVATGRFVRSELDLDRKPVEGKKFGSMMFATGEDGSADAILLPPGEYTVEVESYPCGTNEYWAARGPVRSFVVEPAKHVEEIVEIDVRNIKPSRTYDGRRLKNCKP